MVGSLSSGIVPTCRGLGDGGRFSVAKRPIRRLVGGFAAWIVATCCANLLVASDAAADGPAALVARHFLDVVL